MELLNKIKESIFGAAPDYQTLLGEGALVVDVRSESEFESGHAKDSINIPVHEIAAQIDNLKNKVVILVCRSGMRASNVKKILHKHGIEAYNAGPWQSISRLEKE
jgi:rhodanese-related sulfurtransferase